MSSSAALGNTQLGEEENIEDPQPPSDKESTPSNQEQQRDNGRTTTYSFLVDWTPNEKDNPRNWSVWFKIWCTFQLSMLALAASLGSSIIAPGQPAISAFTGVSSEVTVLCISLYILFAGVFGSSAVSNVAAAIGDIWEPSTRGTAIGFYGLCVVGEPTLGPVIGSALVASPDLDWRWTEYIEEILTFTILILTYFAMPEMYPPVLLKRKAFRLRQETGNQAFHHSHEQIKLDFKSLVTKQFSRPIMMLLTEPMVSCIALYASFVYALLYLTLETFPIVFEEIHGWSSIVGSLPFLGLFVGVNFGFVINMANQSRYRRIVKGNKGKPVPEARLAPMIIGGILFAIGLFWFGWTVNPNINWVATVISTVFIGAGFFAIFQQCINFLIDTYGLYAASVVSANTFLRSILAATFPLVAKPMFHNLGVGPAMSILGGLASIAIAAPFLLIKYGVILRSKSKFATLLED